MSIIWVWVSPRREVANSLFLKLFFFEVDWQSTGKALSFAESVFLNNQSRMSIAANCCCCLLLKILMNYISQCRDIRANFSLRLWSSFCKMIGKWTIINTTNTSFFFRLACYCLECLTGFSNILIKFSGTWKAVRFGEPPRNPPQNFHPFLSLS